MSKIIFLLIPFTLFCFNQWEIYTLSFSFFFALRRLVYFVSFIIIDKFIFNYEKVRRYLCLIIIFLLLIILFMSEGYLPAFVGSIIFCLCIDTILRLINREKIQKYYFLITLIMICGLSIYMKDLSGIDFGGNITKNVFDNVVNLDFIKGILIMLGSSVIDSLFGIRFGVRRVLISLGIIVLLIYIFSLYIFFSRKIWKKTYMPLLLIMYCFINIFVIYYARAGIFGIEYLSSSRYICETILGVVGVLLILIEYILNLEIKNIMYNYRNKCLYIISILSIVFIFTTLISSYAAEMAFASHRKRYANNLIYMMRNIDQYSDEELNVFQANEPSMVRNGIKIMKKYKLGLYNNDIYDLMEGKNAKTKYKIKQK